jgi:hypothetical protein
VGSVGGRHEQVVALDLVVEVLGDLADHGAAQPGAVEHPDHADRPAVGLQADAGHARAVGDDIGPRTRRVDDQAGGDVADPPACAAEADVVGGRRRPHDTAPGLETPHVRLVQRVESTAAAAVRAAARTTLGRSVGAHCSASAGSSATGASGSPTRSASIAASAASDGSSKAAHRTSSGRSSGGASSSSASRANRGPEAAMSARTTSLPWPGIQVAAERAVEWRASSGPASRRVTEAVAASS